MLSLNEAAEISGYAPGALRVLALKGTFPAKKIGNQWTITRSRLAKWMKSEYYRPKEGRPRKTGA